MLFSYLYDSLIDCNSTYRRLNNKLKTVINTASGSPVDMDYQYDALGNLAKDSDAEIDSIYWTLSGKVHYIKRENNSDKENLLFEYDPAGNRIAKHVFDSDSVFKHSTYYVRDAQGNILSAYNYKTGVSSSYMLKERNMYGSSRIGINTDSLEMIAVSPLYDQTVHTTSRGLKHYELTNHLGNVLAVVSDRKLPYPDGSLVDFYQPEIVSATDYYPGGMLMPGRNFNANSYSYGFNGQMKTDEISGSGNHNTAMFWEYDTRLVRRWNLDPVVLPSISLYSVFTGNPILYSDIFGNTISVPGEVEVGPPTEFASIARSTLNAISESENGKKVVEALESSPNIFTILENDGGAGTKSFSFEKNKVGGGTINAASLREVDKKQAIETLGEELFHGFQYENFQDPQTIDSEVGATLFGKSLIMNLGMAPSMPGSDPSASENYKTAIQDLLYSDKFNLNSFRKAVTNFKSGSGENLPTEKYPKGPYDRFPIVNLEKPLISNFFPLY